jgi:uncharacterized protein (TIGR02996 family)
MNTVPAADLAPFLDAVLAEPDDDAPKLVLADYLEERGDGRGKLLREGVAWLLRVRRGPAVPSWTRVTKGPNLGGLSARQRRLFVVACVRFTPQPEGRRYWDLLPDAESRAGVAKAELVAHGLIDPAQGPPPPPDATALAAAGKAAYVTAEAAAKAARRGTTRHVARDAARRWQEFAATLARELTP